MLSKNIILINFFPYNIIYFFFHKMTLVLEIFVKNFRFIHYCLLTENITTKVAEINNKYEINIVISSIIAILIKVQKFFIFHFL